MKTTVAIRLLLKISAVVCVVASAASCGHDIGLGDRGHGIYFHNATASNVVLYELGRERPDVGVHRMAPNALVGSSWIVPANGSDDRTVRVEATSDDKLIYCRVVGWKDLENLNWRIEITQTDTCP
jgi:hypothetical protein